MLTQVGLIGPNSGECGYCKTGTSRSYYVSTPVLNPADYQALCDNNWRRSGTLCYRFDNSATCCPAHTIRLRVDGFEATKEQVRLVRRFNAYLRGEVASVQGGGGTSDCAHGKYGKLLCTWRRSTVHLKVTFPALRMVRNP